MTPRICIAVETYHKPGQTFVNRHIRHMFGGNTCVYANRFAGPDPYDKAVFVRSQGHGGPLDALARPFVKAWSRSVHRTSRMPHGAARRGFLTFLREQQVDAILAEFGTEAQVMVGVAAEAGIPCFTYWRGSDASHSLNQPTRAESYRRMMPRLAGMFAVSRFLLDNLAAHGIAHPNAHVVPSGVDVRRFVPGDKTPGSYLAVGRMVQKKAPKTSLRAFADATRGTMATLRFIGDGPELEPTRALAAELGIADRVRFDGAQPHDVVRDALAETQVFVQHSVVGKGGNTEGLPTSIQEALASGCVVISTRHAGIPEAVEHGVNGWLCDEHDLPAMTDLIRRSLTADTAAMARAARDTAVSRFDNDVLLARVEDMIRAAL
ncbi:glycosyl transferase, group 1 [Oceaniovalibus guishaninsula JLT2003]|uniref:Glycosyl transferase, group 1 n=1 Tax=Oceaniovalibus guishaninsula JLT2003 TaxID=1231392 RepID=K2HT52_9RHOB|nr:glycosyltransferase [Oceaniovalibus guishaninsula]EKE45804.1 glycosyl transferase, group 1 [Oceaniovalibus guishaninsula JLT2003]